MGKGKLKACPFCGCKVIEIRDMFVVGYKKAVCTNCGGQTTTSRNITEAVKRWNRRKEVKDA